MANASTDGDASLQNPVVKSYRERKKSGLSGLSLRFDASYGAGALRPITCRYGLSRGSSACDQPSSSSSLSSSPGSEGLRTTLLPWEYPAKDRSTILPLDRNAKESSSVLPQIHNTPGGSDIVLAAENRNNRKTSTGRTLAEAHRVLSETFTIGRGERSLASLAQEYDRLPQVPVVSAQADISDHAMRRRIGGDRKLRMARAQDPNAVEGMMVRGHGYRKPNEEEKKSASSNKAHEKEPTGLSHADRERQRIRATMASMKNEMMGTGAKDEESNRMKASSSSDLLQEAASRGARMRQSREIQVAEEVQSNTETGWTARTMTGEECSAVPKPVVVPPPLSAPQQGLFTKLDPREAERTASSANYGQPVTQSSIGFDKWTVRRSSAVIPGGGSRPTVVPTVPVEGQPQFNDLEVVDDDNLGELGGSFVGGAGASLGRSPVKGTPIDEHDATTLKELMFGSAMMSFNSEWMQQNLAFSTTNNINYGIVQHKGGPCGVLAVVQAYVMKMLLFGSQPCGLAAAADAHTPSPPEQRAALAAAIAEMLWKCGHGTATVALSSGRPQFPGGGRYKSDGITETLQLQTFNAGPPLLAYIREQLPMLMDPNGSGCVLLTYSAVLSRGIDGIKQDMDVPTNTVIGQHGYCTQELVNLLLTGTASSNVFNGTTQLGSGKDVTVLRGVQAKSEIGLLSLFEHYKSCEVGSNLKSPLLPIWVILSESHFTCLFSSDRRLCSDPPAGGRFDLFYYDMLARQDDQIRLTVEYGGDTGASPPPVRPGELVPPLEHCLRTRWAGASVSWNGYEPIL